MGAANRLRTLFVGSLFFFCTSLFASEGVRLDSEGILITSKSLSPAAVLQSDGFTPYDKEHHLNLGFTNKHVWLKLSIVNDTSQTQTRMLVLDNPLLETAAYDPLDGSKPRFAGMLHISPDQSNLRPAFSITLGAHQTQTALLHVVNTTTALQFGLALHSPRSFESKDRTLQHMIVLFIGMICAFGILSLTMYFYARDTSYLYYVLYLCTLLFQQLTYTGFLPMYAPQWFTRLDDHIVVPKIALMIAAAALYARSFLKTRRWPGIDRIYRLFILVCLAQIPLVGTAWFYLPEFTVFTGLLFILFNTVAGIMIYRRGHKEARFFIAAWLMLVVGYSLMIVDALGWVSIMYRFPELILAATAIEALLLLLAFIDRFYLYQQQKLAYERRYNRLLSDQNAQIETKVIERTDALNHALHARETLYKELHHRVKNNLQLILSIIRLQARRADRHETAEQLQQLQGRIETIARTHELLYQQEGVETVDMNDYLKTFSRSMLHALTPANFRFQCDCTERLPLREAVYVGLIVNELFTNALKHATNGEEPLFGIRLKYASGAYRLEVTTPYHAYAHENGNGLGLTIVHTLVVDQLGGTLEQTENDRTHTRIRFTL